MDCATPSAALPPGFHGARLRAGVAHLERPDGQRGCFSLPPGWYYSDEGRARIAAAVDSWQVRLDDMEAQLSTLRIAARQPPAHAAHGAQEIVLAMLAGAALGAVICRFFTRRTWR